MTETSELFHQRVLLARLGEITLKGMNRHKFEEQVIRNMRFRLKDLGAFTITQNQSRIWVKSPLLTDDKTMTCAISRLQAIFGLVSISPVWRFSGDIEAIEQQAAAFVSEILADGQPRTFKIESRRGLKSFPLDSPQISERVGGFLLARFPRQLTVQVKSPAFILYIEVRETINLYTDIIPAPRGLPVGMGGTGLLMLSGGIDSPVAGYLMASRGMRLEAIYFHAFPFTSDQAKEKVEALAKTLSLYAGRIRLHVVQFTEIQLALRDHCPPDMMTIVMRRMMMRIADRFAQKRGLKAIITGESLGQVASQTLEAMVTTDGVCNRPVFRPLIGLDKNDTVAIARKIGTYPISILPFEDCCTVFVAKHPKTHPSLHDAIAAEQDLDLDALTRQGIQAITSTWIDPDLESIRMIKP